MAKIKANEDVKIDSIEDLVESLSEIGGTVTTIGLDDDEPLRINCQFENGYGIDLQMSSDFDGAYESVVTLKDSPDQEFGEPCFDTEVTDDVEDNQTLADAFELANRVSDLPNAFDNVNDVTRSEDESDNTDISNDDDNIEGSYGDFYDDIDDDGGDPIE